MDLDFQALAKIGVEGTIIIALVRFILTDVKGELAKLRERVDGMSGVHGPDIKTLQKESAELKGEVAIIKGLLFRRVAEKLAARAPRTGEFPKAEAPK